MSTPPGGPGPYGNSPSPGGPYGPPLATGHPAYGPSPHAPGPHAGGPAAPGPYAPGPHGTAPYAPGPAGQGAAQAPRGGGWVPTGVTPPPNKAQPGVGERQFTAAPRRSRTGLAAQYVLQYVYIPLWATIAVTLLLAVIAIDIFAEANLGLSGAVFDFTKTGISWRRLRAEWTGRPDLWAPFTAERFAELFPKAEKNSGWEPAKLPPSGVRRAVCELPVRHYRGLDSAAIEQLAGARGWAVDWEATKDPRGDLHLFRLLPPPPLTGVPDPYGPAPRRGEPWGPLPRRLAVPLLTFVFVPRLRALELRGSADAYAAHLRAHLPRVFAAETKRNPRHDYLAEDGVIMRRVKVPSWHFRGAGAHAVLRAAAELGWQLDPAFPPRPQGPIHLCRPDSAAPRKEA